MIRHHLSRNNGIKWQASGNNWPYSSNKISFSDFKKYSNNNLYDQANSTGKKCKKLIEKTQSKPAESLPSQREINTSDKLLSAQVLGRFIATRELNDTSHHVLARKIQTLFKIYPDVNDDGYFVESTVDALLKLDDLKDAFDRILLFFSDLTLLDNTDMQITGETKARCKKLGTEIAEKFIDQKVEELMEDKTKDQFLQLIDGFKKDFSFYHKKMYKKFIEKSSGR